jgi:hypothetical protein
MLRIQGLHLAVRTVDHQFTPLAVQRHGTLADPAYQVDRSPRRLAQREQQLVFRMQGLELFAHRVLRAEKPIGRHHTVDPLVRTMVVKVGDEVRKTLTGFIELLRLDTAPEFLLHRLPEALAFS